MAIGDNLNKLTFTYLLQGALDRANDDVDKRQGSIIYDTLAPLCYLLAGDIVSAMRQVYFDNFYGTATGDQLDRLFEINGIYRAGATQALVKVTFRDKNGLVDVPIGTQFRTRSNNTPVVFTTTEQYATSDGTKITGTYKAQAQVSGKVGNEYVGDCDLISFISGITQVTINEIVYSARDKEDDDSLRSRAFDIINAKPFAGNIRSYENLITDGSFNDPDRPVGVSAMQVYPCAFGAGTVLLSLINASYQPLSAEELANAQEIITEGSTSGVGLAPIDADVTVSTPVIDSLEISLFVSFLSTAVRETVIANIKQKIFEFINTTLREQWTLNPNADYTEYTTTLKIFDISTICSSVDGIADIREIQINGSTDNYVSISNATQQKILSITEDDIIIDEL